MSKGFRFCDFVVKYDPSVDTDEDVTKRILYSLYVKRVKAKKPVVTGIFADSGTGKSWGVIRLMELLSEMQGYSLRDEDYSFMDNSNVYVPIDYPEKLDKILFDPRYKSLNMFSIHEGREVMKGKNWHTFLNQAIGDVNALSRTVKRLMFFIIGQFIKDIDSTIRYTINYYIKVSRPIGKKSRMSFYVIWKDDRDLDKPKLKKRRLSGYLVYPDGVYRKFSPTYFEMSKPSQDLIDRFEKSDYDAKAGIIKNKMDRLINDLKADMGVGGSRVDDILSYYTANPERLSMVGKRFKNGFKVSKDFKDLHDLSREESKRFEKKLNDKLGGED